MAFFVYSKTYLFYNYIGDNMNSIEIIINGIGNNVEAIIDVNNLQIIFNGQKKYISKDDIDEFIRIIRTWKNDYGSMNTNIDCERFYIRINMDNRSDVIKGSGNYPENYLIFKEWLGNFYD